MAIVVLALVASRPRIAEAQERQITCESRNNHYQYCNAPTAGRVRIARQLSDTRCVLNRTWGFDERGVWVDRGCRAQFAFGGSGPSNGSGDWQSGDYGRRITCESRGTAYQFCNVTTRGDVRLVRQLSERPCQPGRTWGFQRDGIWVDDGCRAEFELGYADVDWGSGNSRSITCESDDMEYTRCRAWTYGRVRLSRQLSSTQCVQGRTWGYDRDGVWVDRGCRGIFVVGAPSGGGGWGAYQGGGGSTGIGVGGFNGSWEQLRSRAYDGCIAEARRRGYNNTRAENATRDRATDDVSVTLSANRGSGTYRVACLYQFRPNTARITGETMGARPR